MKFDWFPERPAFLDFETQSSCPLTTVHKWAKHPSTTAMTCCVKIDGEMHRFGPYFDSGSKERLAQLTEGCTIVAHNAPFDEAVWTTVMGMPERSWFDTLRCARAAALPGRLEDIGQVLTGRGKDKSGARLIDLLCVLKPGQKPPAIGPAHDLLLDYNQRDVELLEEIFAHVKDHVEPDVMTVDATINERGIPADRKYLEWLKAMYAESRKHAREEFDELTDSVAPTSPKQVRQWLADQGYLVPDISKSTYKDLLENPDKYCTLGTGSEIDDAFALVQEAMELRREIVRVGSSKVDAFLEVLEDDGRMRDQVVYWGAHTGRWTGRKIQPHNMPGVPGASAARGMDFHSIPDFCDYDELQGWADRQYQQALLKDPKAKPCSFSDVLSPLVRHAVRAESLNFADYGAVELRAVAWLAGAEGMLEILADPERSIYIDAGERLLGEKLSKTDSRYGFIKSLVLGSTYGMSGKKFENMCKMRDIDISLLRQSGVDISNSVKQFRQAYPEIPALWQAYGEAVKLAVQGVSSEVGRCKFYMEKNHLVMQLPGGRKLYYRNARIDMMVPGYCKLYGLPEVLVPTVTFDFPRMRGTVPQRKFLYGSLVCENAAQATCRDLLAEALVESEKQILHPIVHIHDEIGSEGPEKELESLALLMSIGPDWAEGFPILVEGYSNRYWTKMPRKSWEKKALSGRLLK